MVVLGLVTIGQSPRDDLADEIRSLLPAGVDVVQSGALDPLSHGDLAELRPRSGASCLTTTLSDGRDVHVDRDLLVPLVERAIATVEGASCDVTLLLCTGSFPPLSHRVSLLHAEPLLTMGVAAIAATVGKVGIVAPLPEQQDEVALRWREVLKAEVFVESADPYSADVSSLVRAASKMLAERGAELVVLDCMGYRESARSAAAEAGVPVVLASALVGRLAAEFLSGLPKPIPGSNR